MPLTDNYDDGKPFGSSVEKFNTEDFVTKISKRSALWNLSQNK